MGFKGPGPQLDKPTVGVLLCSAGTWSALVFLMIFDILTNVLINFVGITWVSTIDILDFTTHLSLPQSQWEATYLG